MENLPILYLLHISLTGLLVVIAIWSRRAIGPRIASVVVLFALVLIGYFYLLNLLGRPQPIEHASFEGSEQDATVLATSIDEGKAIYLWLRIPGINQPRYYRMNWDHEVATSLKRAIDQSLRDNTSIQLNLEYETSLENRQMPKFYNLPQPRLPMKPPPEVFEYRNPDSPI